MINEKFINIINLINNSQNRRNQILEYINKSKRNIFNSFNNKYTLDSYVLFRINTVDDLLMQSSLTRIKKRNFKRIINSIKTNDCNIFVNKLVWIEQNLLCNKIKSFKKTFKKEDILSSFNINNNRGVIIIKYIIEDGILLDQDRKNGLIVIKIQNITK